MLARGDDPRNPRREGRLRALADELGGPSRALAIFCDVTDWQQVKTLTDHTAEVFGRP